MKQQYVFTGGYTVPTLMGSGETVPPRCEGIITFAWNEQEGTLEKKTVCRQTVNPSWVEADPAAPSARPPAWRWPARRRPSVDPPAFH